MSAGILNFDNTQSGAVEQGAKFKRIFTLYDSSNEIFDLSTYLVKMQVRKNYGSTLIIELSTENGRIDIDSNSNLILEITSSDTALLPAGNYLYDLILIDPDGENTRIMEGKFVVKPRITL